MLFQCKTETPNELPIETIEKNFYEEEFTNEYLDFQVTFDKSKGFESVTITNCRIIRKLLNMVM